MTTERERRYIDALYESREAVMAVADAEQAELRAEVKRLCGALKAEENAHDRQVDRAADAEAKVARVEAALPTGADTKWAALTVRVSDIRAALDDRSGEAERLHGGGCVDCDNGVTGFHRSRTDRPNRLRKDGDS